MWYLTNMKTLAEKFRTKYIVDPITGCWLWANVAKNGYGQFFIWDPVKKRAVKRLAHRVSYELHKGPIPEGKNIDHMCHNNSSTCQGGPTCIHRRCVNPDHIEPATCMENIQRGKVYRGDFCRKGHSLTGDNLYVKRDGERRCKTCHNQNRNRDKQKDRDYARRYRLEHPEKVRASMNRWREMRKDS